MGQPIQPVLPLFPVFPVLPVYPSYPSCPSTRLAPVLPRLDPSDLSTRLPVYPHLVPVLPVLHPSPVLDPSCRLTSRQCSQRQQQSSRGHKPTAPAAAAAATAAHRLHGARRARGTSLCPGHILLFGLVNILFSSLLSKSLPIKGREARPWPRTRKGGHAPRHQGQPGEREQ